MKIGKRAAQGRRHVEGVARTRGAHPLHLARRTGNEPVDVVPLRRTVERHHHRAERADVAHPARLGEEVRDVVSASTTIGWSGAWRESTAAYGRGSSALCAMPLKPQREKTLSGLESTRPPRPR